MGPSGDQIWNYWKWSHLVTRYATYASGVIWWPINDCVTFALGTFAPPYFGTLKGQFSLSSSPPDLLKSSSSPLKYWSSFEEESFRNEEAARAATLYRCKYFFASHCQRFLCWAGPWRPTWGTPRLVLWRKTGGLFNNVFNCPVVPYRTVLYCVEKDDGLTCCSEMKNFQGKEALVG